MATWRDLSLECLQAAQNLLRENCLRSSISRSYYSAYAALSGKLEGKVVYREGRNNPTHADLPTDVTQSASFLVAAHGSTVYDIGMAAYKSEGARGEGVNSSRSMASCGRRRCGCGIIVFRHPKDGIQREEYTPSLLARTGREPFASIGCRHINPAQHQSPTYILHNTANPYAAKSASIQRLSQNDTN